MAEMNGGISLEEKLMRVPDDRVYARLDVARAVLSHASNSIFRIRAMTEIDACKAELRRRGLPPSEEAAVEHARG